ncbi:MAG TPA: PPOX class F420-dependent oxidoreductase [Thermomicrobiales bacterium]|jgi:PPOX class probable F420-dependent enzyme
MTATIPDKFLDLVRAPGVAVLTTLGPDGSPQTTALWYFLDDDGFVKLSLNVARRKTKNLTQRPACTLFFLDPRNPYRTLEIRAEAAVAPDEGKTFAARVGTHYGTDFTANDQPGEERVIVTLHPVKINTFGA